MATCALLLGSPPTMWHGLGLGLGLMVILAAGFWIQYRWAKRCEQRAETLAQQLQSQTEALATSERRAHEASQAKNVFIANMSHELRTPMNAILGYAQLMDMDARSPEDKEHLGRIHRAGEHLLGLINDILSISRIEAGKLALQTQPFPTEHLLRGIQEMVGLRAEQKGLSFTLDIHQPFPATLNGDAGRIRQVLLNLLGNAVKFTQTGSVSLRVMYEHGDAHFDVVDTGPGMTEGELATLFKAFEQTQTGRKSMEGTGLGLYISKAITEQMGGSLTVRSTPGLGTVFTLSLPLPEVVDAVSTGDQPPHAEVPEKAAPSPTLDPSCIRRLPADFRQAFLHAMRLGDVDEGLKLLARLPDQSVAGELRVQVRAYRIQTLITLFEAGEDP